MLKDGLVARRLVLERDLHTAMQVAGDLEPLANDGGVELDFRKDCGIGMEVDSRPGASRRAELLQWCDRLPLLEPHLPLEPIPPTVAIRSRDRALTTLAPTP